MEVGKWICLALYIKWKWNRQLGNLATPTAHISELRLAKYIFIG